MRAILASLCIVQIAALEYTPEALKDRVFTVIIYMIGISESHEMWTQSATANSVRMRFMICLDFRPM